MNPLITNAVVAVGAVAFIALPTIAALLYLYREPTLPNLDDRALQTHSGMLRCAMPKEMFFSRGLTITSNHHRDIKFNALSLGNIPRVSPAYIEKKRNWCCRLKTTEFPFMSDTDTRVSFLLGRVQGIDPTTGDNPTILALRNLETRTAKPAIRQRRFQAILFSPKAEVAYNIETNNEDHRFLNVYCYTKNRFVRRVRELRHNGFLGGSSTSSNTDENDQRTTRAETTRG